MSTTKHCSNRRASIVPATLTSYSTYDTFYAVQESSYSTCVTCYSTCDPAYAVQESSYSTYGTAYSTCDPACAVQESAASLDSFYDKLRLLTQSRREALEDELEVQQ